MVIGLSTVSGVSYGGLVYYRNMIPALARVDKKNNYIIFIHSDQYMDLNVEQHNFKFIKLNKLYKKQAFRFIWEQLILPFQIKYYGIDVFFTAKNLNVFLSSSKTVIAIRNMEPFFYQFYKNRIKLNIISSIRKLLTIISMKKASRIIAPSLFVKTYIRNKFPYIKNRIDVVYNGNPVTQITRNNIDNTNSNYLLTSSKFVSYANQLSLLKAYNYLIKNMNKVPELWFAGGVHDKNYFNTVTTYINDNNLNNRVRILGLLEHKSLINIYSNAIAFIFPSTLEACPHTLIEVMSCQIPMAVSNYDPMPEICGKAAIYFDPYNEKEIASSIQKLLTNTKLRKNLKKNSQKQSELFDWDISASTLINIIVDSSINQL